MAKKLRYQCYKCDKRFVSWQKRAEHCLENHKPPQKKEKRFIQEGDYHRLIGGINLRLGDKIEFKKVGIISKITITEGNNVAEVEVSVISDFWNKMDC